MLPSRTETILKSIVEQYIDGLVPVPSQSIPVNCKLEISPATVRNEMAYLEDNGYINRPHTSAGAVPSDKGYRYYVESLSDLKLPPVEQRLITHLFHQVEREVDEWLQLAASLVSRLSQNVAIVTRPKSAGCRFRRVDLVALRDSLVLVILVLNGARVKQQLIDFEPGVAWPELSTVANRLNELFSNQPGSQIETEASRLSGMEQQVTDCILKMMRSEDEQQYHEPYLDGLHYIVSQPEFVNAPRMQGLVEVVEHGDLLRVIVPPGLESREVRVVIGGENEAEAVRDCSVVIGHYGLRDEVRGTIGVVGPTRMRYTRTIPAVSYLSRVLSQLVSVLYDVADEE